MQLAASDKSLITFVRDHVGISSDDLSRHLGVSKRTVRSRIHHANAALAGVASIEYRDAGYELLILDDDKLDRALEEDGSADRLPSTPEERVNYLLDDLLQRSDWISIDRLAEILYVSRACISRDLKHVERVLAEFNLVIERKPHRGIRVLGSELDRRLCRASMARENGGKAIYHMFDHDTLERIARCLESVLSCTDLCVSEPAKRNLLVHIAIALLRIGESRYIPLDPAHIHDMNGTREYAAAERIAHSIEHEMGVQLPCEEITYIAIHLAGRQTLPDYESISEPSIITDEVWQVVSRMLDLVWKTFRFDFRNDLELRMNLARHIVPLAFRLRYHMKLENPLLSDITSRFPLAYTIATDASAVLATTYGTRPSEDEIGYLALAFALALERQKQPAPKKRLLLVCASGRGTAKLLEYRCKQEFGEYLDSILTCDYNQVKNVDFSHIDYVFTTVPLDADLPVPVRQIALFLDDDDVAGARLALSEPVSRNGVQRFFREELFYPHLIAHDQAEVLDTLCRSLASLGGYGPKLRELVQAREDLMSTAYGNGVAVPHPLEALKGNTLACVALLDEPVAWGQEGVLVDTVLLVAYGTDDVSEMGELHRVVVNLLFDTDGTRRLREAGDFESFSSLIGEEEGSAS